MLESIDMACRLSDPTTSGYVLLVSHVPTLGAADESELVERRAQLAIQAKELPDPVLQGWTAFIDALLALRTGAHKELSKIFPRTLKLGAGPADTDNGAVCPLPPP